MNHPTYAAHPRMSDAAKKQTTNLGSQLLRSMHSREDKAGRVPLPPSGSEKASDHSKSLATQKQFFNKK